MLRPLSRVNLFPFGQHPREVAPISFLPLHSHQKFASWRIANLRLQIVLNCRGGSLPMEVRTDVEYLQVTVVLASMPRHESRERIPMPDSGTPGHTWENADGGRGSRGTFERSNNEDPFECSECTTSAPIDVTSIRHRLQVQILGVFIRSSQPSGHSGKTQGDFVEFTLPSGY
ncbi:hypothetical protein NLI96_g8069 [Meripilus lineatus]|uniref:Uncharacterized protein n=1 Tax=Meripilus lineatus TaxID=2056292 RepID=A0AAD5YBG1_9APHY|nr:hypothetical protein NLI96_g8069 [Physisporinus lineatus]